MKKFLCSLIVASLCALSTVAAFADTPTSSSPVELTVTALQFNVSVPTSLPVTIDEDNVVTVASETPKIENNSNGPIKVTDVAFDVTSGWIPATGEDSEFDAMKVDSNKFILKINNSAINTSPTSDTTYGFASASAGYVDEIAPNGSVEVPYSMKTSPISTSATGSVLGNVEFSFDWSK